MTGRWLQAVINIPADRFTAASEFLAHGDMHLELQRTSDNQLGVHLDLLVGSRNRADESTASEALT